MSLRRTAGPSIVALLLLSTLVAGQQPPAQLDFLGVVPPKDDDYRLADNALKDYLNRDIGRTRPGFRLDYQPFDNYGDEIRAVTERGSRPYLARITPYAYVTAWILGAEFDVLATYESVATGSTTYRSYFVVNKERFGARPASLDALREFLKDARTRPQFVYHDPFSTSSYFLPAMWLRRQLIFDMPASSGALTAIEARANGDSSSDSVRAVAEGRADVAAVWDGTKKKFEGKPEMAQVLFIPLPDPLPNDLLVASNTVDAATKAAVVDAVGGINGKTSGSGAFKPVGDFNSWVKIQDAPDARQALANLRQMATAPAAPVVVDLHAPEKFAVPLRKALRLAYPEYVLFDSDFHQTWDVKWTVSEIHDGAIELAVEMNGGEDVAHFAQRFPISYVSADGDLTTRIMELIHARMNRVRYVWPYQEVPTVLGDLDFKLDPGTSVRMERITWVDPQRNDFKRSSPVASRVERSDLYRFTLPRGDFRTDDFHNPLSNVAYRALLIRPSYESRTTRLTTVALVVLLLGAAVGAGVDLRRKPKAAPAPSRPRTLDEECAAEVRATHAVWSRPLNDADQLWCDREQIDDKIGELKTQGLVPVSIGGVTRHSSATRVHAAISLAKGAFGAGVSHERGVYSDLVVDPREVGDTVRLGALLRLMIDKELLSSFVGRPVEWNAMNRLATAALGPIPSDGGTLNAADDIVVAVAAKHFEVVLDEALEKWSLFRAEWTATTRGEQRVAVADVPLPAPLELGREKERVQALRLTFDIPAKADIAETHAGRCACWLFGKLLKVSAADEDGITTLVLKFGAIAVLGDTSPFDVAPNHGARS